MTVADAYEHAFVETNGIRLHVVTAGDSHGWPILLLHGFPEFWYGWRHQIPALVSAGFWVIVPDQRGYSLSDKPKGVRSYETKQLALDVIGLLDYFGIGKTALVGHDWGAAVAWEVALAFPERVGRLAILNVPHPAVMMRTLRSSPRQMLKSWYIGFFQIPGLADWVLQAHHFAALARMLRSSGKAKTFSDSDLAEYRQAWEQPGALTAMINWYREIFRERSSRRSHVRVRVPTLVLWGKHDVALSPEMAQRSVELCDDGQLVYFENATHWVQHDEAEEVNRRLVVFFTKE
ncbi:MAG TPA: alpha/beta hydrolase [Anaerolineales bacterium]|nr:alpha/beta hydrolase [Anaerolineales bacterium]